MNKETLLKLATPASIKVFILGLIIGCLSIISFQNFVRSKQVKRTKLIESEIRQVSNFILDDWGSNFILREFRPPQVIPVLRGSRIQGACGSSIYDIGNWDIGGSSFCDLTNTIYLVPEELLSFKKEFGISTVGFVVAHEFAHALQQVIATPLRGPSRELHADCIAGMFLKAGNKELGITREGVLELAEAKIFLGGRSHGSGLQRKYALLSGMGVIPSTCSTSNMQALANGEVNDEYFQELKKSRSAFRLIKLDKTLFPKDLEKDL